MNKKYNLPPTTIEEQIEILRKRGLIIDDLQTAQDFLRQVSYYRFSMYALHYDESEQGKYLYKYKEGTTFEMVLALYEFDPELRRLLFTAIENIEIAFRSQLCLQVALSTKDSHWHLDSTLFKQEYDHKKFIEELNSLFEKYPTVPSSPMGLKSRKFTLKEDVRK